MISLPGAAHTPVRNYISQRALQQWHGADLPAWMRFALQPHNLTPTYADMIYYSQQLVTPVSSIVHMQCLGLNTGAKSERG